MSEQSYQSEPAKCCPKCQSTDIQRDSLKKKKMIRSAISWIVGLAAGGAVLLFSDILVAAIVFGVTKFLLVCFPLDGRARCLKCSHRWKELN